MVSRMKRIQTFAAVVTAFVSAVAPGQQPADPAHHIVAAEPDKFNGWPANNGVWQWGNEILVGFTQGDFSTMDSHNIKGGQESHFARSTDGGETWTTYDPENFLDGPDIDWKPKGKKVLRKALDFTHEGFALRVFATGYHGNDDPEGGFYYSLDRGATWEGPWFLGDLHRQPEFRGRELTPRTDYIVLGPREALFFITANGPVDSPGSQVACVRTRDGGTSFHFVAWVTPQTDEFRAIMPSTVRLAEDTWLCTYRKIYIDKTVLESTIEASLSEDGGKTWRYRSTIKKIAENSNPPATVKLADGRLCTIYGDRDTQKMCGKYSTDNGKTWGEEFILRDTYKSTDGWADMGYPRLVQRPDGKLVALYYWASEEHPQQHIAATIWTP